ncbi:MAG: TonB family protein [Sphingorhabdus sp.]|uniref:energy transducer TonB n=1 Tax=Sphingorhabdus sp. TaxID=1902408 RepID=UPI003CA893EC
MSYATENKRPNPMSMALAIGVNGSIILAVALSPVVVEQIKRDPFIGEAIDIEPLPPKADEKKPDTDTQPINDDVYVPPRETDTQTDNKNDIRAGTTETDTFSTVDGKGAGEIRFQDPVVEPPTPIFRAASRDPRFARDFQPDYPPGLLQKEIEGSASIRVLIGSDGRVREAQVVRATHPDFGRATVKQALKAWRFTPAMRGDVPVEDWQTLSVRFTID